MKCLTCYVNTMYFDFCLFVEPPVCFANVSGRQYYAGEFVSFTCTQYFHKDVWAPRMQWSWVSPNISLTAVNYTDETKAEYTVVLEIRPEYNGRQLRCDIIYDKLTPGTYPRTWDFATNVPQYRHNYTTRLDILRKSCISKPCPSNHYVNKHKIWPIQCSPFVTCKI